jgi:hypothetical protein
MDSLTIGRIVIFVDESYNEHPALITRVHNLETGIVNLLVIEDRGIAINPVGRFSVPKGDGEPYTWHWNKKE